jgi:hypothetical protein
MTASRCLRGQLESGGPDLVGVLDNYQEKDGLVVGQRVAG